MESRCWDKVPCDEETRQHPAGKFPLFGSRETQWGLAVVA